MQYTPGLDGLRAIAALSVVAFHCATPGFGSGYLGVDVFFVLSGFLITRILSAEIQHTGRIAVGRFYFNRLLRLYPTLLLVIAAFMIAAPHAWPDLPAGLYALLAGLYLTDYSRALWDMPVVLSYTWSLSVEEHFYLMWPLVLPAILRTRRPAAILAALYVLASGWRWWNMHWLGWEPTYFRFDTRLSGLILGGLMALAPPLMQAGRYWKPAALLLVVLTAIPTFHAPAGMIWAVLLVEWATVALIAACCSATPPKWLQAGPLTYLGKLSYGIYLWHFPLAYYMREVYPWHITLPGVAAAAFALAAATYHGVDAPLRRFRRGPLVRRPAVQTAQPAA